MSRQSGSDLREGSLIRGFLSPTENCRGRLDAFFLFVSFAKTLCRPLHAITVQFTR